MKRRELFVVLSNALLPTRAARAQRKAMPVVVS
jgi:hypothetical protein